MYVTLKFFDFKKKNDTFKSHGSPLFNAVVEMFVSLFFFWKFVFFGEKYNPSTAVRSDVKGNGF